MLATLTPLSAHNAVILPTDRASQKTAASGAEPRFGLVNAPASAPPASGPRAPVHVGRFTSPSGYPLDFYVLWNGHRVLIEQRPQTDAISLRTFIKTGSINENPILGSPLYNKTGSPSGIAHLDEHCHFLTTQHFPRPYSWTEKVSDYGADFNASTSTEVIQHEMVCNSEDLPSMIALHGEAVLRPNYQANLIDMEKTNVINEIGERSRSAYSQMHNKLAELLFDRPDFQTHGKINDIKGSTVDDLKRFQYEWYTPTNMLTVVSGNCEPTTTVALLNRSFGNNPPRITSPTQSLKIAGGGIRQAVVMHPDLVQPSVMVGFPAPGRNQMKERMALTFLQVLLGSGPTALLQETLKDQQQLVNSLNVAYEPYRQTGSFEITMDTPPGKEQAAVSSLMAQLRQLAASPLPKAKVEELCQRIVQTFDASLDDVEISSLSIGEETLYQSLPYLLKFHQLAEQVTPEQIQQVAQRYVGGSRYAVVFGYPKPGDQSWLP